MNLVNETLELEDINTQLELSDDTNVSLEESIEHSTPPTTPLTEEELDKLTLACYYYAYGEDFMSDTLYEKYMTRLKNTNPDHFLCSVHWSEQGIPYHLLSKYNLPELTFDCSHQKLEDTLPPDILLLRNEYLESYKDRYSSTSQKSIELIQDYAKLRKRVYEIDLLGKVCHLSIKADGQNFTAIYFKGNLVFAQSKGKSGNPFEITAIMRNVLPNKIDTTELVISVSGENVCFKDALIPLQTKYKQAFKTTRSAVSSLLRGGLNLEDVKTYLKPLVFKVRSESLHTLSEEFTWARIHGFNTPIYKVFKYTKWEDLVELINEYEPYRSELNYSNDGLVLSINDNDLFYSKGDTSHHYNGNLAVKVGVWSPSYFVSTILGIEWYIGDYYFTPVAKIVPVTTDNGTDLSSIPLGSPRNIIKHNLNIGSEIYFKFTSDSKITFVTNEDDY